MLEEGKIPNSILKELVINKIHTFREEVVLKSSIGEDCCAVSTGEKLLVMSCDPITGASENIGNIAVHISCNDVASCGIAPVGIIVVIMAPLKSTKKDISDIMEDICQAATELNIELMGGHTEVTSAVNKFVVVTTVVGIGEKESLISTKNAKSGYDLVITKTAGIEGTAIIAADKYEEIKEHFGLEFANKAKEYINKISSVKDGVFAAKAGAKAMHDITEGGVFGAVWEMCDASNKGAIIYNDTIPIGYETQKICEKYSIDPRKLISSGSMLIACENGDNLVKFLKENKILATKIGKITDDKNIYNVVGNEKVLLDEPSTDELYKVIRRS